VRFPRIGYGCAPLIGGRTTRESLHLLEIAYDTGVRHFDVARVYGSGDAEAVLGRFAESHRDEITITTKFGIRARASSGMLAVAKAVARPAFRRSRSMLQVARRHTSRAVTRGLFTPADAVSSLEVSLAALRCDYVDALLLHDCSADDWQRLDLIDALTQMREDGRIGSFGTATSFAETRSIVTSTFQSPSIVQFESDALSMNLRTFARLDAPDATPIVYGVVRGALAAVSRLIADDPSLAGAWSRTLDIDARSPDELCALMLSHQLWLHPRAIVLFSSGAPERVRANVQAVMDCRYDDAQLRAFDRLLEYDVPRGRRG
jgi:diketogulonate reductase-like aldo/keto reductase